MTKATTEIHIRKMKKIFIAVAALTLLLCSCGERKQQSEVYEGVALGTFYKIIVKGKTPVDMQARIDAVFEEANNSVSVFNPNSLLSRINRNETDWINGDIFYCLEMARSISELSEGRYDVTVQPLMRAYGFRGEKQDEDVNVDSILQFVGYKKISISEGRIIKQDPRIQIDLNSIAKGATVDQVAWMLEEQGITEYLVNVGGEIMCRGTNREGKDWTVGVETPVEGNFVAGNDLQYILKVSDRGMATSGNYRNFHTDSRERKFTHIVNPVTGENTSSNLLSATVIAESCALADAMGTMFIALGLNDSIQLLNANPEIAALLIFADDNGDMQLLFSDAMRPYMTDEE